MWHDNETTVDYVNFGLVAKAAAALIEDAAGEPISIGVSGGWGTGKSSLVRMIADELAKSSPPSSKYVVVTFNPWLYQGFEDARSALLQTVGDALLSAAAADEGLAAKAKSILKRVNYFRLLALGGEIAATLITGIPVGVIGKGVEAAIAAGSGSLNGTQTPDAKSLKEATTGLLKPSEPVSLPKEIHAFRLAIEELLLALDITLVVFVDDLDRCLPHTAISTLESLRLLLFLKHSAFVIAADEAMIRGAVLSHFADMEMPEDAATNYFDKLIQVPLHVPRLGINEAKGYMALLFMEQQVRKGRFDGDAFKRAKTSILSTLDKTWAGSAVDLKLLDSLATGAAADELRMMFTLADRLAALMVSSAGGGSNPRLIKRFLNTVFLRKSLADAQKIPVDFAALAKWHLLERYGGALAEKLATKCSSAAEGRVVELQIAEAAQEAGQPLTGSFTEATSFEHGWLSLEPKLGDVDLRPIVYLSRDSTVRDFGASELTAEGRDLLEALATSSSPNAHLSELVKKAGESQAGLAMSKVWALTAGKRTWKKTSELTPLLAVCRDFPQHADRARALLLEAPVEEVAPAWASLLGSEQWAVEALRKWHTTPGCSAPLKRAIDAELTAEKS